MNTTEHKMFKKNQKEMEGIKHHTDQGYLILLDEK